MKGTMSRWAWGLSMAALLALPACSEEKPGDRCQGVECDQPPPATCLDATTRTTYASPGTCGPATGACTYTPTNTTCPEACREGSCVPADLCSGVTCDSPPAPACQDATTLLVYGAPGTCSPADGSCSYPSDAQACQQVCQAGVCDPDLGDDFGLLAREGTRVCSRWSAEGIRPSYAQRSQVHFRPGLYRLPRDQASFGLDPVEAVTFGPGGAEATPLGAGIVDRALSGTPEDGTYVYTFRQPYDTPLGSMDLEVYTTFRVVAGVAAEPIAVLDDLAQLNRDCWPSPSVSLTGAAAGIGYATCQFDDPDLFSDEGVLITAENGDQLRAELSLSYKCCCMRPGDFAELRSLRFTRGGEAAEATDFYALAFSAVHHHFGRSLMAVFPAPLGQMAGVLVVGADATEPTGVTLQALDADLAVLETLPVASIQQLTE
jgi:hypothetical protein